MDNDRTDTRWRLRCGCGSLTSGLRRLGSDASIAILGAHEDPHIQAVCAHLATAGVGYSVIDIYAPPGLSVASGPGEFPIAAVWRRLKPPFKLDYDDLTDYYDRQFAIAEWRALFAYMFQGREAFSLNSYDAEILASNKLRQLEIARRNGLHTPKSVCSNDPVVISEFLVGLPSRRGIHKSLTGYRCPSTGKISLTSVVDCDWVEQNSRQISICPSLFQEEIVTENELRITVVGDQVFSALISKANGTEVDWRRTALSNDESPFAISDSFRDGLLAFHRALGLSFGAYDFMIDSAGEFVFLEVNPVGQWLWLERKLDLPISKAIADLLIRETRIMPGGL